VSSVEYVECVECVERRASSVKQGVSRVCPVWCRVSSEASSFVFVVSCRDEQGVVFRVSRVVSCRFVSSAHTYQEDVEKFQGGSAAGAATSTGAPAPAAAEYEDVPTSNMRRTIGKRLTESKQQVPHYYLTVEINMGE
jgi:hypothetical protein